MNFWKKCPLLIFLLVSGFIISVVSLANRDGIYRDYERESVMTPALAAFFEGIKEEKYPWTELEPQVVDALASENEDVQNAAETAAGTEAAGGNENQVPTSSQEEEAPDAQETERETKDALADEPESVENAVENEESLVEEPDAAPQEELDTVEVLTGEMDGEHDENRIETVGPALPETEAKPQAAAWQLGAVEEAYFDDALFIGDSRTQGLYEYGGFGENVTFYCKTSLTIYDLFKKEKAFIKEDGKNITLEQALTEHSFKKIYLMIGINELGTGTAESFFEEYARAVYKIQQLQPDAIIFVQAIMRVGAQKNASDPIFNNTNIAIRNVEIQTLADNQRIFYIDVNEVVCDENGNLFEGWSSDQIHLKAKYYAVWKEFLMNHGAVPVVTEP